MDTTHDGRHPAPRRTRRGRLLAAGLCLTLLAASCGDGSDGLSAATDDRESGLVAPGGDTAAGGHTYSGDDDAGDGADDEVAGGDADRDGLFAPEPPSPDPNRLDANTFRDYGVRPFVDPNDDPLSTFALDVDTGAYTVARRWLHEGVLPERASVRVEEFVNAFDYDYDAPRDGLALHVDGGPSPFDEDHVLVRVGVQAEIVEDRDRPPASLTFVVDTSGSMDRDDRLGLVRESLRHLVDELDDADTVAIVDYGTDSNVVLEPTGAEDRQVIRDAIDDLRPGGSTNLEAGLRDGYRLAERSFVEDGINRVVLASDGVANVGSTDPEILAAEMADRAIDGIQLVTIGYGMGNFNDVTMERLADRGDGFYAYVDDADEAERLFEDELVATLAPVAVDARIQVEWDPDLVDEYRLVGFENRGVLDRDFRTDDVDAGELSSNHSATAVYELDLDRGAGRGDELGRITLRWQRPADGEWVEVTEVVAHDAIEPTWSGAHPDLRLATTVVAWSEVLRGSEFATDVDLDAIAAEARALDDELRTEQTRELAELTRLSADLAPSSR